RRLEDPRTTGFAFSQNKNSETYEDEGEQRPDIREVHHFIDAGEHRTYANGHTGENRGDVRRAKSRMHLCERLREYAIRRKREKDPGLPELKDQEYRRVRHDRTERDNSHEQVAPSLDVGVLQCHR